MTDPTDDLQPLIAAHRRRLRKLRERQARLGFNTPPEVETEIEDIEAELARLGVKPAFPVPLPLDVVPGPAPLPAGCW